MNTKTIYKYPLAISDGQAVLMPVSAEILSVQFQGEDLCIWALVDSSEKKHARIIRIIGKGNPFPIGESLRFIGAVQHYNGRLVWHVFEQVA